MGTPADEPKCKLMIAFWLNVVIAALVVLSIGFMMVGISRGVLASAGLVALRYFTIDSNIIMGVVALIGAFCEWQVLRGARTEVPAYAYIAKLMGTVGVTLTMLITVFYLTPNVAATMGPFALFLGSNFFLHLANPLLAIICFAGFEKTESITFKHTFTALIPVVVYAVYYVSQALAHATGGVVERSYDWYGFFVLGVQSMVVVLPLILAITYAISLVLWRLNRRA